MPLVYEVADRMCVVDRRVLALQHEPGVLTHESVERGAQDVPDQRLAAVRLIAEVERGGAAEDPVAGVDLRACDLAVRLPHGPPVLVEEVERSEIVEIGVVDLEIVADKARLDADEPIRAVVRLVQLEVAVGVRGRHAPFRPRPVAADVRGRHFDLDPLQRPVVHVAIGLGLTDEEPTGDLPDFVDDVAGRGGRGLVVAVSGHLLLLDRFHVILLRGRDRMAGAPTGPAGQPLATSKRRVSPPRGLAHASLVPAYQSVKVPITGLAGSAPPAQRRVLQGREMSS